MYQHPSLPQPAIIISRGRCLNTPRRACHTSYRLAPPIPPSMVSPHRLAVLPSMKCPRLPPPVTTLQPAILHSSRRRRIRTKKTRSSSSLPRPGCRRGTVVLLYGWIRNHVRWSSGYEMMIFRLRMLTQVLSETVQISQQKDLSFNQLLMASK